MHHPRRQFLLSSLSLAAGATLAGTAMPVWANPTSNFPRQPIRIVVPGAPGGGTDLLARSVSVGLAKALGQTVLVDNRPGASGIVAAQSVLSSPTDGHTLYMAFTSIIQLPSLMSSLPVDFQKEFAPVSLMAFGSDLLAVSSRVPATSVAELVALAKAAPGKMSIGSYGNGTSSHLHGALLQLRTGIDLIHVPYKGAAPLLSDLLGGQIDAAFVDQSTANSQLQSDKLRFLALTGTQGFKPLPQLRTLGQLGYEGFESNGFMGIMVAAGTPEPIIQLLSQEIATQTRGPEVSGRLADIGMESVGSTPEEFAAVMARDAPRWARITTEANIKLD